MRRLAILLALPVALATACGNNSQKPPGDAGMKADAPAVDAGVDASCIDLSNNQNPTNNEIINACTTAQKIYKTTPPPPHMLPDGGLPPLP